MGLVGDIASAASGALGSGGPSAPAAVVDLPMTFAKGDDIDPPEGNAPGATAPNSYLNVFDVHQPIQFVHFGRAHNSVCDLFLHDELADDKANALKTAGKAIRGLQFRAALEREALLTHGFIRAAQRVVEERKQSSGDVEALANMASSLMGGGSSGGPQPQNFDPYLDSVGKAGGTINKKEIKYKEIHKAGKDLHQARTNFKGGMPKLLTDSMGSSEGNPLGNLTSMVPLPTIPGVGNILNTVMDIMFKMFELHAATYAKLREKFEPAIEEACYKRSLEAIREPRAPVFDVWSRVPPEEEGEGEQSRVIDMGETGIAPVDDAVNQVNQTAQDVKDTVSKAQKAWQEFWSVAPDPGPGETQLRAAFAPISKPGEDVAAAFKSVMKVDIPGFIRFPLDKICAADAGMLQAVFLAMQDPQIAQQIDADALMAAGRAYIKDTVRGVLSDLLPGFNLGPLSKDWATDRAASTLDQYLGEKLEPIIETAMGGLLVEFDAIRQSLDQKNAHTLEPYLAGAPLMLAVMVRNTYFPIWQLLVDEVLARVGAGAAAATSPVRSLMDGARGAVADARNKASGLNQDIKDKATGMADDAKAKEQSLKNDIKDATYGMGGVQTPLGDAVDGVAGAVSGVSDSLLGSDSQDSAGGGGPKFPGAKREALGSGTKIEAKEWKEVQKDQLVKPA